MQDRHADRKRYFREQSTSTARFVIPYILSEVNLGPETRVLEVGCGEGGNLVPFLEQVRDVVGVDISPNKVQKAQDYLADAIAAGQCRVIETDIRSTSVQDIGQFDLIFLRDVIEHIPEQHLFLRDIRPYLKPNGVIFFAFPPWYMPFGGHQQVCRNKLLSVLPFTHLLPRILYKRLLSFGGESPETQRGLMEIRDTGITIERFRKIVDEQGYQIVKEDLFLLNPNYEIKFGIKGRKQLPILRSIPYLRNFYTTCMYAVIRAR